MYMLFKTSGTPDIPKDLYEDVKEACLLYLNTYWLQAVNHRFRTLRDPELDFFSNRDLGFLKKELYEFQQEIKDFVSEKKSKFFKKTPEELDWSLELALTDGNTVKLNVSWVPSKRFYLVTMKDSYGISDISDSYIPIKNIVKIPKIIRTHLKNFIENYEAIKERINYDKVHRNDDTYLVELTLLKKKIVSNLRGSKIPALKAHNKIFIPSYSLEDGRPIPAFELIFIFGKSDNTYGRFYPHTRTLIIYIISTFHLTLDRYAKSIATILETAQHELLHLLQKIPKFGQPSDKLKDQVPESDKNIAKWKDSLGAKNKETVEYYLDDSEFYTWVKDTINVLSRTLPYIKKDKRRQFLKEQLAPNDQEEYRASSFYDFLDNTFIEFFFFLKKYNPPKYKKAVKVVLTALSKKGLY